MLCLGSVLDASWYERSVAVSRTAIQRNLLQSACSLLDAVGAREEYHFDFLKAHTIQYLWEDKPLPVVGSLLDAKIGVYDSKNNRARLVHCLSPHGSSELISASIALVDTLCSAAIGEESPPNIANLISKMPRWESTPAVDTQILFRRVALIPESAGYFSVRWSHSVFS